MATKLKIKLVKSTIGQKKNNRAIIAALGLRKTGGTVLQPDNPSIRGMIHHVKHMLEVHSVEAEESAAPKAKAPKAAEAPKAEAKAPKAKKAETTPEPAAEEAPKPKKPRAPKAKTSEE